jgi:hypothetical protein
MAVRGLPIGVSGSGSVPLEQKQVPDLPPRKLDTIAVEGFASFDMRLTQQRKAVASGPHAPTDW